MKYLSLFTGIGGFEVGINNSKYNNFECIGFSEIDKYAKSIYKRHFPKHDDLGDATKIRTDELPNFDLLVGGFPCQAFSVAGKRRGFDDTRGTLFFEIARILKAKKPRYFLLENVKGLLSHDKGNTFKKMLRILDELGYNVQWQIYNSKNFGVPQNRERIYIKGFSRDRCGGEVLSFRGTSPKVNNKIKKVTNGTGQGNKIYSIDGISCALCGNGGGHGGKTGLYLFGGTKDNIVRTIDANYHKGISPKKQRRTQIVEKDNTDKIRIRRLTPVECERLQGFEDNWTKYGADNELISDTQRYKCCGNAVTTNVVTHIMNNWDLHGGN